LRMAAVLAGVALAGVIWHLLSMRPEPMPSFADAARVHEARPGQRLELRLSDGTRVVLAPASVLRIADEFGKRSRRVQLDGEAYFAVTHDATKPFVVHTAHGLASDLGTKFVVRAFPTDTAASAVVAEGVVSLKSAAAADSVLLYRGDLGRIAASGELTAERDVDLDAYFAWTEGRLVFDDTPLNEAVMRLNHWYDLDIRLADSTLTRLRVTAVFTDESASQMLQFLTLPLGLEYEEHGRTIVLRQNRR
jgi:transmembrane sensor